MKLSKKQQKFIKQAYKDACQEWKIDIKKNFPKLFKTCLKAGDWARVIQKDHEQYDTIVFLTKGCICDFNSIRVNGEHGDGFDNYHLVKATREEVEKALIKEAKRRGFVEGATFKQDFLFLNEYTIAGLKGFQLDFGGYLCIKFNSDYQVNRYQERVIFSNGKWAKILKKPVEMTVKEILIKRSIEE